MIVLITAIMPEANAILSAYAMKKIASGTFPVYESEEMGLRLLVTGPGKLSAAMTVTEYITLHPSSGQDIFCNLGICGGSEDTSVGDGYLCASVTDASAKKSVYPELYTHPFCEARLITSDIPVTSRPTNSEHEGALPLLYDMEAYGVASALFRSVTPSHCFFYKVVSDHCDGNFPTPDEVTKLLLQHLTPLLSFLKELEERLACTLSERNAISERITALTKKLMAETPLTTAMERRLHNLLTYALHTGLAENELYAALPDKTDTPHKKREALARLQTLENYILTAQPKDALSSAPCINRKLLHPFHHIYVEHDVLHHPITQKLIERFPSASVIPIDHYKDVFNRSKQNRHAQETEPALILAVNRSTLFYPGAPVCQSFGEEHFMYTSCIMNCLYDCDYCYLQGMYPSGNLVVFVNLEDYFAELDALLSKHPVYLCCSYDSDLTALSGLLPHAEEFCRYALMHPNLRLELRTKSAALPFIKALPVAKNIVMAFTVSPQEIITRYEHYTPSLKSRLATAKAAAEQGFSLRLCFDPILDVSDAETLYTTLVEEVFSVLLPEDITDISLGVFRLSKDYIKQLKKAKPACALSHYPYELTDGVCHYRPERCDELLTTVRDALQRHGISDDKLFFWAPEESEKGDSDVNK